MHDGHIFWPVGSVDSLAAVQFNAICDLGYRQNNVGPELIADSEFEWDQVRQAVSRTISSVTDATLDSNHGSCLYLPMILDLFLCCYTHVYMLTSESCDDRYPNDTYDRVWTLKSNLQIKDNSTVVNNTNILNPSNFTLDQDRPPFSVMQNGWLFSPNNVASFQGSFPSAVGRVYTVAYFQELEGSVSSNVRGMDYILNGNFITQVNTSAGPKEISTIRTISETTLNLTFAQSSWSQLGPLVNALEIYSIFDFNTSTSVDEDGELSSKSLSRSLPRIAHSKLNLTGNSTSDSILPNLFKHRYCK